jgi:hypothetical protein
MAHKKMLLESKLLPFVFAKDRSIHAADHQRAMKIFENPNIFTATKIKENHTLNDHVLLSQICKRDWNLG